MEVHRGGRTDHPQVGYLIARNKSHRRIVAGTAVETWDSGERCSMVRLLVYYRAVKTTGYSEGNPREGRIWKLQSRFPRLGHG